MSIRPPEPADPHGGFGDMEEVEDVLLEGDRAFAPGTARSAWSHAPFRTIYLGAFASNIGTWMQNVVLGALAYDLTGSGVFVGIVTAAQLGPLLLLSLVGGALADAVDRKRLLVTLSVTQGLLSLALAAVALDVSPNRVLLVAVVLAIGCANALYAPTFSAVIPILVPRRDLAGAISLNSVQMNASRVVGPAIGSLIFANAGASFVFLLNGISYAAVIVALTRVPLPEPPSTGTQGLHRLLEGIRYARAHREVGQVILVIFIFSLLALPFITQMPTLADENLGLAAKSEAYGLLYAAFGLGAVSGALSVGTLFAGRDKARLTRIGLVVFAVLLAGFSLLRAAPPAYPVIFAVGAAYFTVITSLSTVLQEHLDDGVRGKVMALWIMGFGGTVPFGGLAGGWIAERTSITTMVLVGAAVAATLAAVFDLRRSPADVAATAEAA
ncbi:MFS transporter [Iamia sp. SCSIO 61187]|uniref:MFS transporter n=1 Tax=Iamia sp. SCSIO 61187 TaxID=2722752 RepID=UPI001C63244B|nr:MFS transporter [Iamia sp. SCSIO 61187]QYG93592.1 MFS transporter [Iamia sp. SCSIO 61187]